MFLFLHHIKNDIGTFSSTGTYEQAILETVNFLNKYDFCLKHEKNNHFFNVCYNIDALWIAPLVQKKILNKSKGFTRVLRVFTILRLLSFLIKYDKN